MTTGRPIAAWPEPTLALGQILPELSARFAATADQHDRDASFPFENFRPCMRPAGWP